MGPVWKGQKSPKSPTAADLEVMRNEFKAADVNHDGKITMDEYIQWKMKQEQRDGDFASRRFRGEAWIPVEKELHELEKRIEQGRNCWAFMHYAVFVLIFFGIVLCNPNEQAHKMETSVSQWIATRKWGDYQNKDITSVAERSMVWEWLEQALIPSIWGEEITMLDFNPVKDGLYIGRNMLELHTACAPHMESQFPACPHWVDSDNLLPIGGDRTDSILPFSSMFLETNRSNFEFAEVYGTEYNPVSQNWTLRNQSGAISQVEGLQNTGWFNLSTPELMVAMVSYNKNTNLWMVVQVRFIGKTEGQLKTDIFAKAFQMSPLGSATAFLAETDYIEIPPGAAWQFRVFLEILFVINIGFFACKEFSQIAIQCRTSCQEPIVEPDGQSKKAGACLGVSRGILRYLSKFYNILDLTIVAHGACLIAFKAIVYVSLRDLRESLELQEDNLVTLAHFIKCSLQLAEFDLVAAAFCILITWRLLGFLAYHPRFGVVWAIIESSAATLVDIFITVSFLVVGFGMAGFILFGSKEVAFETPLRSLAEMFRFFSGEGGYNYFEARQFSAQPSSWAYIPLSMFWYGFHFTTHMILAAITAVMVVGFVEKHKASSRELRNTYSLVNEVRSLGREIRRLFGCTRKPRAAIDPLEAYLVPEDCEDVRPALSVVFNELASARTLLISSQGETKPEVLSYRCIRSSPELEVKVTYDDLAVLVRNPAVCMYLWAKYGPGASSLTKKEEASPAAPAAAIVSSQAHEEQAAQIRALSAKLDLIISTLGSFKQEDFEAAANLKNAAASATAALLLSPGFEVSKSPVNRTAQKVQLDTTAAAADQCRRLLENLVRNGPCELQIIKDACAFAEPAIPWETAKSMRRMLGILQYKDTVRYDGVNQVVRFWKQGSPQEVEQAARRREEC